MNDSNHDPNLASEHTTTAAAWTRRNMIAASAGLLASGTAGSTVAASAAGGGSTAPLADATAFAEIHTPRPLKFDTARLRGLSKALIESHWANNYSSSVRTLNAVKAKLAAATADAATPPFVHNGLKREHLMRTGSVVLHDLYFENLGGSGQAGADVRALIAASFGTFDAWETEFRRIATGLGGGSGWVVLGYNWHFRTLENYWLADHLHGAAGTVPLLVLDMYEHAYAIDYGAAAARYIDAAFANFDWEVVLARVERARRAGTAS